MKLKHYFSIDLSNYRGEKSLELYTIAGKIFKMKPINYKTTNILGYNVFSSSLEEIELNTEKTLINTINQYSYCLAEKDKIFKKALMDSNILLPDGIGIIAASKLVTKNKIIRITGAKLHKSLLEKINKRNGKCFYLGSSSKTLDKIEKRCNEEYPNIIIEKYSPPFKIIFTEKENQNMMASINNFRPDILFIGMTAPKQEKWANRHKDMLNAKVICSIGAVFDFYSGTVIRPNKMWQNLGLEWLGRLLREPKRLWKRYLLYGPIFIYYVLFKRNK